MLISYVKLYHVVLDKIYGMLFGFAPRRTAFSDFQEVWVVDGQGMALDLLFSWISTYSFKTVAKALDHDLGVSIVLYMGQHAHFLCARDRVQPPLSRRWLTVHYMTSTFWSCATTRASACLVLFPEATPKEGSGNKARHANHYDHTPC